MKWVTVNRSHFNTDLIQAFSWSAGKLRVWWHGEEGPDAYDDPNRVEYLRLCRALGVKPEGEGANGKGSA